MTDSPAADKKKYPRELGMLVAGTICRILKPACARLVVAGSLRRGKAMIGDVEIIYIPRKEIRKSSTDMFSMVTVDLPDEVLSGFETEGFLARRLNARGSEMFGPKNKLMIHVESGLPVDFFSTTEECWFNYLVCRTGPAESNIRIAEAAKKKGWKWNPYGSGFSHVDGNTRVVESEKEVFDFVGLPYLEPQHRR